MPTPSMNGRAAQVLRYWINRDSDSLNERTGERERDGEGIELVEEEAYKETQIQKEMEAEAPNRRHSSLDAAVPAVSTIS